MPGNYTYPGVYVEEIPSGVRTITGVSTSNTAFVGFFKKGPMEKAVRITSYADFERKFGGLDSRSEASYAIRQYYLNGGSVAWVVRMAEGTPSPATLMLQGGSPLEDTLRVDAANEGEWGSGVRVAVTEISSASARFNIIVREVKTVNGRQVTVKTESHLNLSMSTDDPKYVKDAVNDASELIRITDMGSGTVPTLTPLAADGSVPDSAFVNLAGGSDGQVPDDAESLVGVRAQKSGIYALEDIAPEIFNILCLPLAANFDTTNLSQVYTDAAVYCEEKRAFLIMDIPASVASDAQMRSWMGTNDTLRNQNSAVYFPRLLVPDPLNDNRTKNVGPSGTLAGIFARTDGSRGVWKAPAGIEAKLKGAQVAVKVNDLENGSLNPIGVNVLRTFPVYGNICWGGRTMAGADQMASEWKYIPVRRTALFIEESLFQGLKWVVFEPNDEPLWSQVRLNVGAFMHNLFRQGAFQGATPKEAYFVKCDSETTTQNDIDLGIVNIWVGFAPLKPAEFVILKLQQIAGQIEV